jgi:ArsR family transcriptional regulator
LTSLILPAELLDQMSTERLPTVIDVRGEDAYRAGHIAGARHIPAGDLQRSLAQIPRDRPVKTY